MATLDQYSRQSLETAPWTVRAVQLDLARQMETLDFIRRYCDFIGECGFNTLVLYLEGRVRTEVFPYRPVEESYTLEDMAQVLSFATDAGLAVVPVVPSLAHCEYFVSCPEMAHLAEEVRGGFRLFPGASTLCPSAPEVQEFWPRYWAELAQVFTGPDIHVGLDEAWNLGCCPECRTVWQEQGLGGLFLGHVQRMHKLTESLGKRMWMWDDCFELFPETLSEAPRSIVMCHWNYDEVIDQAGAPAHFGNRFRQDWLAEYERMGFDALVCPWSWYPWNIETFTAYGRRHRVLGGLLTQWEMAGRFHEESRPLVAMTGRLWSGAEVTADEAWRAGISATVPRAEAPLALAVRELSSLKKSYPSAELGQYLRGPLSKQDRLCRALVATGLSLLRLAGEKYTGDGVEVLEDLESMSRLEALYWELRDLLPVIYDPRRTAAEAIDLRPRLAAAQVEVEALKELRMPLHDRRRPGMHPPEFAGRSLEALEKLLAEGRDRLNRESEPRDWLVQLRLYLPDITGCPVLTFSARFGAETRELASGVLKPTDIYSPAYYTFQLAFVSDAPPDEIVLEVWGYGGQGVCYLEAYNPEVRLRPQAAQVEAGEVRDPKALLRDDSLPTYLGERDVLLAMHNSALAEAGARLAVKMG